MICLSMAELHLHVLFGPGRNHAGQLEFSADHSSRDVCTISCSIATELIGFLFRELCPCGKEAMNSKTKIFIFVALSLQSFNCYSTELIFPFYDCWLCKLNNIDQFQLFGGEPPV